MGYGAIRFSGLKVLDGETGPQIITWVSVYLRTVGVALTVEAVVAVGSKHQKNQISFDYLI